MTTTLMQAHKNWIVRPDDERFLTLEELSTAVHNRQTISRELELGSVKSLQTVADNGNMVMKMPSGMSLDLTHWSFGQLCRIAGTPAEYMRRVPAQLAALNLNVGLRSSEESEAKVLFSHNGSDTVRAFNGINYGRIWDAQVVDAVANNIDERWGVPLEAYNGVNSKQATTLYASDRDVFIFLTDQTRPIELDGQTYFRGFYTWNSEVGSATFGIATFLFSYVCANRIIWDARNVSRFKIRHTLFAPERFMLEAKPILLAMSEASDRPVIDMIQSAKGTFVAKTPYGASNWLYRHGFTKSEANRAIGLAEAGGDSGSSGNPTSLWDIVQGGTASARDISHTDRRLQREKAFSSLLRFSGKVKPDPDLELPEAEEEVLEEELAAV